MDVVLYFLWFAVLFDVFDVISSSRMKFCMMAIYYPFNKLQPAGCNRVSPACSGCLFSSVVYYVYSDCVNDLLFYDHNNRVQMVSTPVSLQSDCPI